MQAEIPKSSLPQLHLTAFPPHPSSRNFHSHSIISCVFFWCAVDDDYDDFDDYDDDDKDDDDDDDGSFFHTI